MPRPHQSPGILGYWQAVKCARNSLAFTKVILLFSSSEQSLRCSCTLAAKTESELSKEIVSNSVLPSRELSVLPFLLLMMYSLLAEREAVERRASAGARRSTRITASTDPVLGARVC